MNNPIELVKKSIEYYDKNYEKYNKLFKRIKFYKVVLGSSDLNYNKIYFYDKNKKLLFKSRYEHLGRFDNTGKMWMWAWADPELKKSSILTSRKILNYGFDIPIQKNLLFLKTEFITSRFKINDPIQLDLHISLASYISKIPMIFKYIQVPAEQKLGVIQKVKNIKKYKSYQIIYLFLLDYKKYE